VPEGRKQATPAPRPQALQEPAAKKAGPLAKAPVVKLAVEPAKAVKKPPVAAPAGDAADWVTHATEAGEPYYHNKRTGETSWDKPAALLAEGESVELEGDWVWVMHDELSWIPGKVLSRYSDGSLEVVEEGEGGSGERRMVKAKEVGPVIPSAKTLSNLTADLVQLDEVTEPAIIDLLRRRYKRDKIYTSVGDILVAVNPFKSTPLFTPLVMQQYASRTQDAMQLPPHPYAVINGSLQDLIEYQKDQSLLISGESGAGKTVTVKVCLEFLSEIAGSDSGVEQQILASNPILEAFGNAKTKRNDNSSRFGKFMEVHLSDESKKIVACTTVHYLLEKSRVVAQAEGERNFHIFYYLATNKVPGAEDALLLHGRAPETFKFLSADGSPCAEAEHHNDEEEASAMNAAFEEMKISHDDKTNVFRVVAAVLHMGDLEFVDHMSTGSKVNVKTSADVLKRAATLLGVPEDKLEAVITRHESMQRDGLMTRAFSPAVAADARNALARHLYGRLFDYLIRRVNEAMDADQINTERGGTHFIGMLDIFGFEIFEINSFEQLCINFANEKLQQLFNRHTFTLEERTYEDEGIAFEHITFHDSQPLLTFLGMGDGRETVRDGVFQILDEQTVVGSGTDEKFLQAVAQKHRDKKALFSDLCKSRTAFKVTHYAGNVEYETKGFVTKNADKLYENIVEAMRSSAEPFVAALFGDDARDSTPKQRTSGGSDVPKTKTQASLFMRQLQALEVRTNATFPRYVRCIKPNAFKKPQLFNAPLCLQQLRFAGVFEAVAIRKLGFPFRHTHEHFFTYFKCLVPYDHGKWQAARKLVSEGTALKTAYTALAKKLLADIVAGPVPDAADCRFGKTMVLYRSKENRALEIARLMVLNTAAATIQKVVKGRYVRRHVPELFQARDKLDAAITSRVDADLDKEIKAASVLFFKIYECYRAENVLKSVRHEAKLKPKLAQVLAGDPDTDATFAKLEALVREMDVFVAKDDLAFTTVKEAQQVRQLAQLCQERRAVKAELEACLAAVPETELAASMAAMTKALASAKKVADKGATLGGDSFFRDVAADVQSDFNRLKAEQALLKKAVAATKAAQIRGEAHHSQPGAVDATACLAHIAAMRAAVDALQECEPVSLDGVDALRTLQLLLDLREAFLTALALGEGAPADEPEWRRVEALLRDVSGLAPASNAFTIEPGELEIVGADLALRAAVDDVVMKLRAAIEAVDDEQLSVAVEQARVLKMFDHPDEVIRAHCADAAELLPKVQHVRAALAEALAQVKEGLLVAALCEAKAVGFGKDTGMLGNDVVQRAQQLFAWVVELTAEAKLAAQVLYTEPSKAIVEGCDEIALKLPELEPLRQMLALPVEHRLLRQRDAAVKTGNYARAVRLSIEAKDVLFAAPEAKENFALFQFPGLKTPDEFSRSFGIHWRKYKETMLKHYNPWFGKIHTSLTTIELPDEEQTKQVRARAPLLFRNIFGVMGDKKVVEIDGLAHELLHDCLSQPALRDEVFCQLMKQLTDNPNPESEIRGWNLMAMCLATFPPSRKLEDYLEMFLRVKGRDKCVLKLHQTRLAGPLREAPFLDVVARLRARNTDDFWMPGARESIQLEERMWTTQERVEQVVLDWRSVRYVPGSETMTARAPPKRNSGGFDLYAGGAANKVGPQGPSRTP